MFSNDIIIFVLKDEMFIALNADLPQAGQAGRSITVQSPPCLLTHSANLKAIALTPLVCSDCDIPARSAPLRVS